MTIRIESVRISDTFGTKEVSFRPGTVTRIKAANGLGKSSVLNSLIYVFAGGSDPSVIRKGTTKSEIEIGLNNGVSITKTTGVMKPKKGASPDEPVRYKTELVILGVDGIPIPAPQTYLNELSVAMAIDPTVLLKMDATTKPGRAALAAELMKLVPITFTADEVNAACQYRMADGLGDPDTVALPVSLDSDINLDALKKISANITEQRRLVGQTRDDADGTINRLRKSLPETDGKDYAAALRVVEQEQLDIEKAIADRRVEIEKEHAEEIQKVEATAAEYRAKAEKEFSDALRELERVRADQKATIDKVLADEREIILKKSASSIQDLEREALPQQQRAAGEIATLKEQASAVSRASALKEEIEVQRKTYLLSDRKYDGLTKVLVDIEKLRLEKLKSLPVHGLEVTDGTPYLDGVEWQNVNLARRVEAVLQICTQLTGKLPFVLLDDFEHCSAETRQMLEDGLISGGYQIFEALVTDGPLTIEMA